MLELNENWAEGTSREDAGGRMLLVFGRLGVASLGPITVNNRNTLDSPPCKSGDKKSGDQRVHKGAT
jgi:hypothetical protein